MAPVRRKTRLGTVDQLGCSSLVSGLGKTDSMNCEQELEILSLRLFAGAVLVVQVLPSLYALQALEHDTVLVPAKRCQLLRSPPLCCVCWSRFAFTVWVLFPSLVLPSEVVIRPVNWCCVSYVCSTSYPPRGSSRRCKDL